MNNPRGRPPKYSDRHRFIIEVLHLHGLTPSRIVGVMQFYGVPLTMKAVESIIYRLPYRRKEMPAAVRQRFLDRLKARRLDSGHDQRQLPDEFFIARET